MDTNKDILSQEWFDALKSSTKDMLCRTYEYIEKHHDFTEEGIRLGCRYGSFGLRSGTFIERFTLNFDKIKKIYENRPLNKVVYWNEYKAGDKFRCPYTLEETVAEGDFCHFRIKEFGYYDETKRGSRINHEKTAWDSKVYYYKFINTLDI